MSTLVTISLSPITCYKCGVTFGMDRHTVAQRERDHNSFWCPNGHEQAFLGKSEAERLRDQLAREKHWREQAEARARENREEAERITRRLNATRGVVTRHKKKIAAGRCPCCSHSFKDLRKHMETQHPNWNPEKKAEVRANA